MKSHKIQPHTVQEGIKPKEGILNIVAVGSCKGGVGKSTVALNLAVSLAQSGYRVGLLDADIHGPSQPVMLGAPTRAPITQDKKIVPLERHGLWVTSIGYLMDDEAPLIWRGPMVSGALMQLLNDTAWPPLDILLLDLPPGTGDIQLTLAQKVPLAGVVMVTTPQEVACQDVARGIKMFEKVKVPVLGLVENMSQVICSHCGEASPLFGTGGGDRLAKTYNVPLLAKIPFQPELLQQADKGTPYVVSAPEAPVSQAFSQAAEAFLAELALRPVDYSAKLPKIVLKN